LTLLLLPLAWILLLLLLLVFIIHVLLLRTLLPFASLLRLPDLLSALLLLGRIALLRVLRIGHE